MKCRPGGGSMSLPLVKPNRCRFYAMHVAVPVLVIVLAGPVRMRVASVFVIVAAFAVVVRAMLVVMATTPLRVPMSGPRVGPRRVTPWVSPRPFPARKALPWPAPEQAQRGSRLTPISRASPLLRRNVIILQYPVRQSTPLILSQGTKGRADVR